MDITIEEVLRLRLMEIANGSTAEDTSPPDNPDPDYIGVYGVQTVDESRRTSIYFLTKHSTDGETIANNDQEASKAIVEIVVVAPSTPDLWRTARKLRNGLFGDPVHYWPADATRDRRKVHWCRAAAGGEQAYAEKADMFAESIMAQICFDDTADGFAPAS